MTLIDVYESKTDLTIIDILDLVGYMRKDDILGIFDGSIFVVLAHRYKSGHGGGAFQANKVVS